MKEISIIGGGAWGRALALAFVSKATVTLYALPTDTAMSDERIKVSYNLNQIQDAQTIFLVVPASAMREICIKLQTILNVRCTIIICSKGIEATTGKLMSEVVTEFLPNTDIAILSGPNFASEISKGLPALTSIVSEKPDIAKELSDTLSTSTFRLVPASNLLMSQLFGTLKNVLAMICGAARGLELGDNFVASLITVGVKEMFEFAKHKGITSTEMIFEPAGIGDIFLTCNGHVSRNQTFGSELALKHLGQNYQTIPMTTTIESVSTILALQTWELKTPLLSSLSYELISGKYKTKEEFHKAFVSLVMKNDL